MRLGTVACAQRRAWRTACARKKTEFKLTYSTASPIRSVTSEPHRQAMMAGLLFFFNQNVDRTELWRCFIDRAVDRRGFEDRSARCSRNAGTSLADFGFVRRRAASTATRSAPAAASATEIPAPTRIGPRHKRDASVQRKGIHFTWQMLDDVHVGVVEILTAHGPDEIGELPLVPAPHMDRPGRVVGWWRHHCFGHCRPRCAADFFAIGSPMKMHDALSWPRPPK